jgi:putative ABC transport system substrate-binding protein
LSAERQSGPSSRAQQAPGRIARIVYLGMSSPSVLDPRQLRGLKQGLPENGLVEGTNIVLSLLWAEGDAARLSQLAAELAASDVDVIVTAGPQPLRALKAANVRAPIVMAIISDPIGAGFIESLAHPGGNLTGLSMSNSDLEGKRVEILKEAVPALERIIILHDKSMGSEGIAEAENAARAAAVEPVTMHTSDPAEFEAIFIDGIKRGGNGLLVMASPLYNFNRRRLLDLALDHRLPAIWETSTYVDDGGLLSYGPNFPDMYRRAAAFVARILKGSKPADLPVQQPTAFELAINLKTAKMLGLAIPASLLARADEVIE